MADDDKRTPVSKSRVMDMQAQEAESISRAVPRKKKKVEPVRPTTRLATY